MSLLLDALRKADRERRTGHPDSPFDVAPPPQAPPVAAPSSAQGSSQRALLAVLWGILIAVLILAIAIWQRPSPLNETAPVMAVAPVTPSPTPLPTPLPTPTAQVRSFTPETLTPFEPLYSLDELAMPALQPIEPATPNIAAPAADITRATSLSPPEVDVIATVPSNTTTAAAPPPSSTTDALPSDVMQRRDLPPAVRDRLPNYAIDVHVYNDDPARRFILVAGQRHPEGSTLEGGFTLIEITPQGIVIEVDGQAVLVPLPN